MDHKLALAIMLCFLAVLDCCACVKAAADIAGHMWRQAMDTSDSTPLSATLDVKAYPALHVQTQYDIQAKAAIALLSTPVS